MTNFQLDLTGFEFPEKLPNNKANFRFIVDLRFRDEDDRLATEHAVMPSLDTFWECDPSRHDKPNYVRLHEEETNVPKNKFDFNNDAKNKIDPWDRLILHVQCKSLHSIQFKVIDVDRKDAWDAVKNVLGKIAEVVIGQTRAFILKQENMPFRTAMGAAADDVQSFLLKKLAGGDQVLFRGSLQKDELKNGAGLIKGRGTKGDYKISFEVTEV